MKYQVRFRDFVKIQNLEFLPLHFDFFFSESAKLSETCQLMNNWSVSSMLTVHGICHLSAIKPLSSLARGFSDQT